MKCISYNSELMYDANFCYKLLYFIASGYFYISDKKIKWRYK